MQNKNLRFCFKGDRNYVHGTDIYNAIIKFIKEEQGLINIRKIDISIHEIIKNNLSAELFNNKDADIEGKPAVVFSFMHTSDKYRLLLSENDQKIDCRHQYREEDIISSCKIDIKNKKIELATESGYSNIENYVAMNKALLKSIYHDVKGKWFFTRLQTDLYEETSIFRSLTVELKHNFNFKLTKSLIRMDNREIGYLYFSLI